MRLDNFVTRSMSRAISEACDISLKVVIATNSHLSKNGMDLLKYKFRNSSFWLLRKLIEKTPVRFIIVTGATDGVIQTI